MKFLEGLRKKAQPETAFPWLTQPSAPMPETWFEGFYRGNARYPFNSAAIVFYVGEQVFKTGLGKEDIRTLLPKKKWEITDDQARTFMKVMKTLHIQHGVSVAPAGEDKEVAEALDQRFPDRADDYVRELPDKRIATLGGALTDDIARLYSLLSNDLRSVNPEEERHALVEAFFTTGATLLRTDAELNTALKAYIKAVEEVALAGNLGYLNKDIGVLRAREAIYRRFMEALQTELPKTSAFARQANPETLAATLLKKNKRSLGSLFQGS